MANLIRCYTLFNITATGVLNRSILNTHADETMIYRRNTQCNFDTILQVISLRSQPEVTVLPEKVEITPAFKNYFGNNYYNNAGAINAWKFEFEVQHARVFENEESSFGALYQDCIGVPMIKVSDTPFVTSFLDISTDLRNIWFEECL